MVFEGADYPPVPSGHPPFQGGHINLWKAYPFYYKRTGDKVSSVGANIVLPSRLLRYFLSYRANRLLCPVGHLLYERRLFRKASSTEEVASRRLDGGVSGEQCSPLRWSFSNKPIFKKVPLEKAPVGCALCWDVPKGQGDYPSGTACHLPFQGRLCAG